MEPAFKLPVNKKKFTINIKGEMTNQLYNGEFETVCMPTLRQKSNTSVMVAQLNSDLATLDEATKLYHQMIAEVSTRLLAAPQWWIGSNNGQDLLDFNLIVEIYKQCAEAEREWREEIWGKKEASETKELRDTSSDKTE